jgi:hypothetical protein
VNKVRRDYLDYQANLELKDLLDPAVFPEKKVTAGWQDWMAYLDREEIREIRDHLDRLDHQVCLLNDSLIIYFREIVNESCHCLIMVA